LIASYPWLVPRGLISIWRQEFGAHYASCGVACVLGKSTLFMQPLSRARPVIARNKKPRGWAGLLAEQAQAWW
jgi:hypothetical protein